MNKLLLRIISAMAFAIALLLSPVAVASECTNQGGTVVGNSSCSQNMTCRFNGVTASCNDIADCCHVNSEYKWVAGDESARAESR